MGPCPELQIKLTCRGLSLPTGPCLILVLRCALDLSSVLAAVRVTSPRRLSTSHRVHEAFSRSAKVPLKRLETTCVEVHLLACLSKDAISTVLRMRLSHFFFALDPLQRRLPIRAVALVDKVSVLVRRVRQA